MSSQEGHYRLDIELALARQVEAGADAAEIADTVVSMWEAIDGAMSPILGQRGVALLYKRSLYLTSPAYPWLAETHEAAQTAMDIDVLRSALAQQVGVEAASGGGALLQTFHELLVTLIGPSLTARVLHPVASFLSGTPAQDTST